jgi:ELWxxDGT repeat protein
MTKTLSFRSSFAMSTLGVAALSIGTTAKAQYAQLLGDINTEPQVSIQSSYPSYGRTTQFVEEQKFINLGGKILFTATTSAGTELFSMNAAGTVAIVKDINAGSASSSPYNLIKVGTKVFFTATTAAEGNEIWVTDGSAAGTTLFAKTVAGSGSLNPYYLAPIMVGTTLNIVFRGRGTGTADKGYELYITDGTTTSLLKDIYPGTTTGGSQNSGYPTYMTANGGMSKVYFYADNGTNGRELWATDGTAAGTFMLMDVYNGTGSGYGYYITTITGPFVGMRVYAKLTATADPLGYEMAISGGTTATTKVIDLLPNISGTASDSVQYISDRFGRVIFSANNGTATGKNGQELFVVKSTGKTTHATPTLVKDIYAGTGGSYPSYTCRLGNYVYFGASNGTTAGNNGNELWRTDGTPAGTTLVKDIYAGTSSSYPRYLEVQNGTLYFACNDGTNGYELWKSTGTAASTVMAFQYTSFDLSPYYLTAIGSRKLFMAANVSTYGTEMSFTDTTKAPNLSFWNIHGTGSSSPYNYTNGKYRYAQDSGRVYFRAYSNNVYDYRLWTINSSHTGAPMGVSHVIGDDQGGTAKLSATDCVMGGNMIVKGTTGVANPLNVLMFGVPYEVPYMVPGGFYAYHHPALFWILGNFAGTAFAFNFPIPNDASIAGSQIVLQNWSLNAATFPAGWNLSNGVHCTVGK